MEIIRLHLGSVTVSSMEWPVHGFVITHGSAGPILVDTGVGGPDSMLRDWRAVNTSAADALARHGMSPADVRIVVNTHLHFDHCGWNAVFPHAPFWVQRAEVDRARRESPELGGWWDFAGARFELLDGDATVAEGVRIVATPGHTRGHQSVVVELPGGSEVLIGDAAYTRRIWANPDSRRLPDGQAEDRPAWRRSIDLIGDLRPRRVHFCHDDTLDAVGRS
jgi:N-acyl homoserine lactone hydrolase